MVITHGADEYDYREVAGKACLHINGRLVAWGDRSHVGHVMQDLPLEVVLKLSMPALT